mmetsp:Transcript_8816/g.11479  ORF Transcript_8816/g.11479 Transcript_8816/m.11479 type:complete len:178 (-) Transcript_8816:95-628(-)|eukprot:CAMPEP_0195260426 /NCGR_PEP_ID=MMETSP0706-20130129/8566_1 /TAXON_ID=33640 /ORGANISM="Asterionellopsis glacialis, Strain CCMP134" /LENGTH=177 /DNA_ID=CAMNT_0040314141 /DNA_START=30 /DNA_END=563 /DNA_ORIENTATION=-
MPRLGTGGEPIGGDSGGSSGSPQRRPAASAYPSGAMRGGFFTNFVFLLGLTFILRNMLFNDYRSEEIEQLEASGKTREEIEKYVKSTPRERRKQENEQFKKQTLLFEDVDLLKSQVAELRKILNLSDATANRTEASGKGGENESESVNAITDKKQLRSRNANSKNTKTPTKETEKTG